MPSQLTPGEIAELQRAEIADGVHRARVFISSLYFAGAGDTHTPSNGRAPKLSEATETVRPDGCWFSDLDEPADDPPTELLALPDYGGTKRTRPLLPYVESLSNLYAVSAAGNQITISQWVGHRESSQIAVIQGHLRDSNLEMAEMYIGCG